VVEGSLRPPGERIAVGEGEVGEDAGGVGHPEPLLRDAAHAEADHGGEVIGVLARRVGADADASPVTSRLKPRTGLTANPASSFQRREPPVAVLSRIRSENL